MSYEYRLLISQPKDFQEFCTNLGSDNRVKKSDNKIFEIKCTDSKSSWRYDARFIVENPPYIDLEISSFPASLQGIMDKLLFNIEYKIFDADDDREIKIENALKIKK